MLDSSNQPAGFQLKTFIREHFVSPNHILNAQSYVCVCAALWEWVWGRVLTCCFDSAPDMKAVLEVNPNRRSATEIRILAQTLNHSTCTVPTTNQFKSMSIIHAINLRWRNLPPEFFCVHTLNSLGQRRLHETITQRHGVESTEH